MFLLYLGGGPILRRLGEFGKIRLATRGKQTIFARVGRSVWVSKMPALTDFKFFFSFFGLDQ
jgi:hypothetical protein